MASRMEKYYNQRSRIASRSYRNQLLYQELDSFQDEDSFISSFDEEERLKNESINTQSGIYDDYRQLQERSMILESDLGNRLLERQKNKYYDMNGIDYQFLHDVRTRQQYMKKINSEEAKRIEELITTITDTSRLSKINAKELDKLKCFDAAKQNKYQNDIEIITQGSKVFDSKKIEDKDLKDFNEFVTTFSNDEKRKDNLKLKVLVGLIIIIITFVIIFLIYKDIK